MVKHHRILFLASAAVALSACSSDGSSSNGSSAEVSLATIPSVSSAVKSQVQSFTFTGTPPTLAALGEATDAGGGNYVLTANAKSLVKTAFWKDGGSNTIDDLLGLGAAGVADPTNAQKEKFFGNTVGAAAGSGACFMAQGVAEGIGRMAESMSSTCYMKNISQKQFGSSLTRVSGSTALSNLFSQSTSDKLLKVNIGGSENVFIRTYGTDTVGANTYKIRLHFCNSGTPKGEEIYEYNKSTGAFTVSGQNSEGSDVNTFSLSAGLKSSGGSISFDENVARVVATQYSGTWGKFKGRIEVETNNLKAFRWWSDGTNWNKDYSYSQFSGSGLSTLRFLEGAFKGQSAWHGGSGSYEGATEYSSTHYVNVNVAASAYGSDVQASGPGGSSPHSFFTGAGTSLAAPSTSLGHLGCSETPTDEINFDMSHSEGVAIETTCQSERFNGWAMCRFTDITNAESIVFQDPNLGN